MWPKFFHRSSTPASFCKALGELGPRTHSATIINAPTPLGRKLPCGCGCDEAPLGVVNLKSCIHSGDFNVWKFSCSSCHHKTSLQCQSNVSDQAQSLHDSSPTLVLLVRTGLYCFGVDISLSSLLPVDNVARIERADATTALKRRDAVHAGLRLEIETARRQAIRTERQDLPGLHVAVSALRQRHEVGPTGRWVPTELVRAVCRQGADDETAVVVELAAAG